MSELPGTTPPAPAATRDRAPRAPRPGLEPAWNPEDPAFWAAGGQRVARRNLVVSVSALLLAFIVWMVWSALVVELPHVGFRFTTNQLFWLAALPGLSGATLRIIYAFVVPIFGGRNWTVISTASLLVPAIGMGVAVQHPGLPYGVFLLLALLCGLGGGNFASSMANISFFYPAKQKGLALGINAGLGNLGVSVVQFATPLVIATGLLGTLGGQPQVWTKEAVTKQVWLQNAAFVWVPLIVLAVIAAWFGMNNLAVARASVRDQTVIFRRPHTWTTSWLYTGTFGSFIGYSAAFPLLIKTEFPAVNALAFAWLGPFVGALIRPLGGWLADRWGGARVTFWNFLVMAASTGGVLLALRGKSDSGAFAVFLALFLVLFVTTGIGNGSVFRMIPAIFLAEQQRAALFADADGRARAVKNANKESAAVLGFSSAVAAYGAFIIPRAFGSSLARTGGPDMALYCFAAFYLTCLAVTWWWYYRKGTTLTV